MAEFKNRIIGEEVEDWRPVVGYEGSYEVSINGQVRRVGGGRGAHVGRLLKHAAHASGYHIVSLWAGNKGKSFLVHRLVFHAFVGVIERGKEINHRNGDKTDNNIANLELVTRRENIHHAIQIGLMRVSGTNNPQAKTTPETVRAIRAAHDAGRGGYKTLGLLFGMPWGSIRNIITKRTWANE